MKKVFCVMFISLAMIMIFPVIIGQGTVSAGSFPDFSFEYVEGCVGAVYIGVSAYDPDYPSSAFTIDVYLYTGSIRPSNAEKHTITTNSSTRKFSGLISTNLTGRQTVEIIFNDLDSSGNTTGSSNGITKYINIIPISEATVTIDRADCEHITGSFPSCYSVSMKIAPEEGNYNQTITLDSTLPHKRSFDIDSSKYSLGEVFADISMYDGRTRRHIKTVISADHVWSSGAVVKKATCEQEGQIMYTCTKCGERQYEPVGQLSHSWDSGKITRAAGYTHTGVRTQTCTECGATKTATIAKLNAAAVTPARTKLTAKVAGKKLTLSWKKVAKNTKGYQVALKNKKTGKIKYYNVKASSKKKISKKLKLKKGTYAVMVRAYNVVNGETIYGKWSNVKVGKVK